MPARLRTFIIISAAVAGAVGSVLATSQAPGPAIPATGAITGVVIDGSSGTPVPDAVVALAAVPVRALATQTRQVTDEKGRFAFVNLPGDVTYTVSASSLGYLEGGFGRETLPTDPLRPIPLKTDEWIPNIKVSIWKPGAISGNVRDERGEPVVGVVVRALQCVRIQGRDEFIAGPLTRTDDRGAYRLAGLAPAKYLLQVPSVQAALPASKKIEPPAEGSVNPQISDDSKVSVMDVDAGVRLVVGRHPIPPPPQNGQHFAYPSIFYPSTPVVADATPIALKYGEDRKRADLTLRPVPSVRVSGVVDGPVDAMVDLSLRLLPAGLENMGFGAEIATTLVGPDGRFTFINVPAGSYTIDAPQAVVELTTTQGGIGPGRILPAPPTTPVHGSTASRIDLLPGVTAVTSSHRWSRGRAYTARLPITVGASDINGVVVRLRLHVNMMGQVQLENDPKGAAVPDRVGLVMDPAGGEGRLAPSGLGGRGAGVGNVQFMGLVPGLYFIHLQETPGWVVKSVTWGGDDHTNQPFDLTAVDDTLSGFVVTVTNATPELTGTVRDTETLKADATMVIAFPVEAAQWKNTGFFPARVKTAVVSRGRGFEFRTLPAGEYYVAAISRTFIDTWRDAEFLAKVVPLATRVTLTWSGKSRIEVPAVVVR